MSIKTNIVRAAAGAAIGRINKIEENALQNQLLWFKKIVKGASGTKFGRDHHFERITNYTEFKSNVPIRDYEGLRAYFDDIASGTPNVCWPGKPKYLAKTSGTTSGTKYIPITRQSLPNHINSARNALFSYIDLNKESKIFDGRMLFLSGSPLLENKNGLMVGRLSGIVNHEVPSWMSKTILPSMATNLLEPWERKVDAIVNELIHNDVRVISGIPPWIQMILERMLALTNKSNAAELLPNLELYIHGGVNYQPYHARINQLIGRPINLVETYPASEGFFAYQDRFDTEGLRIISNSGIFYEFIPLDQIHRPDADRLSLHDISLEKDYAIVINSNAGLLGYLIGDVVRFINKSPYRLKVTGRVSQFISAFGEHVIASEIESSMTAAVLRHHLSIVEFMVAPQVNPTDGSLPFHEWFVEFNEIPDNIDAVANTINSHLCKMNTYYNDLIKNKILQCLKIRTIRKNGFKDYMTRINKIGEQFKVTRVCNDRAMADQLLNSVINLSNGNFR